MSDRTTRLRLAFVVQRYGPEIDGGAEYECRRVAEALAAHHDVEVLTTRGLALARAGRFEEALASLARAREVSPRSALVLRPPRGQPSARQ